MIKRTSLHTSEANYIYVNVLLKLNKSAGFTSLSIPVKNKIVDDLCLSIIANSSGNVEDNEALKIEILSYRLSDEEKKKMNSEEFYKEVEKSKGFNNYLKKKYQKIIEEKITDFINQF